MALKKCNECGVQVSTTAKNCPHCGAKNPTNIKNGCLIYIIGFFGVVFLMSIFAPNDKLTQSQPLSISEVDSLNSIPNKATSNNDAPLVQPPSIAALKNIPPKSACSFLDTLGFKTQGWAKLAGGDYGCPSDEIELGKENSDYYKNDIRYYVISENGTHLKELKLMLNVNDPTQSSNAKNMLLKSTLLLLEKLNVKKSLPSLEKAIKNGQSITEKIDGFNVTVNKMNWNNSESYTLKVVID